MVGCEVMSGQKTTRKEYLMVDIIIVWKENRQVFYAWRRFVQRTANRLPEIISSLGAKGNQSKTTNFAKLGPGLTVCQLYCPCPISFLIRFCLWTMPFIALGLLFAFFDFAYFALAKKHLASLLLFF